MVKWYTKSLIYLQATHKATAALRQNDLVAPWMKLPPPNLPHSAPCSHFSDSTLSFSLHWCSSSSPCHHEPNEWRGCQCQFADSSSQWRFLFHSLHYRSPSAKPLLTFISSALSNKSPCSPHPRPQSHADWPDVPSLIMNISIIIRRTTIAG